MWQPRFDWELLLVEKTIITGSSTWKLLNSRLDLKKVIDISDEIKCFIKQLKRQICRNPLPILIWKTTWKPMFCFLQPFFDSTNDTKLWSRRESLFELKGWGWTDDNLTANKRSSMPMNGQWEDGKVWVPSLCQCLMFDARRAMSRVTSSALVHPHHSSRSHLSSWRLFGYN